MCYNSFIEKVGNKMSKPKINKISKEDFLKLNEDDIMFITNPGRMGDEEGSTFIQKKGNEFTIYRVDGWMYPTNKKEDIVSMGDTAKQFPKWYETWEHCNDPDYKGKYKYLYMGFGNGLSIDNSIYNEYEPYLNELIEKYLEDKSEEEKETFKYAVIYNVWEKSFENLVKDKKYILK